jgi:hypothetical protein
VSTLPPRKVSYVVYVMATHVKSLFTVTGYETLSRVLREGGSWRKVR